MKRIIFFYVITSVFSGIMLISGIVALKCPLQWQNKKASYPHYEGRIALQNEQMWNYAQQVFDRIAFKEEIQSGSFIERQKIYFWEEDGNEHGTSGNL